jgi:outer membrane protein OmpA-like peptidoglycan-associated protein
MIAVHRPSTLSRLRAAGRALRLVAPLALAAPLVRCAPPMPAPGALVPAHARTTNELVVADLRAIDGWAERVKRLQVGAVEVAPSPARRYVLSAAAAWIVFARDEYAADPRGPLANAALAEAVRLVRAVEDRLVMPETLVGEATLIAGTVRVRPELWAAVARLRESGALARSAELAGELSVELVRAGRVRGGVTAPACAPALHLAHAERLLGTATATATVTAAMRAVPTVGVYSVYFALNSARLAPSSVRLLDRVVAALAERPGLTLVLEGHADPRGDEAYNVELSRRRAAVVRYRLERSLLVNAPIELRPLGHGRRRSSERSSRSYALDRRVDLRVLAADGTPVGTEAEADELQEEAPRAGRAPRVAARGRVGMRERTPRPAPHPVVRRPR